MRYTRLLSAHPRAAESRAGTSLTHLDSPGRTPGSRPFGAQRRRGPGGEPHRAIDCIRTQRGLAFRIGCAGPAGPVQAVGGPPPTPPRPRVAVGHRCNGRGTGASNAGSGQSQRAGEVLVVLGLGICIDRRVTATAAKIARRSARADEDAVLVSGARLVVTRRLHD